MEKPGYHITDDKTPEEKLTELVNSYNNFEFKHDTLQNRKALEDIENCISELYKSFPYLPILELQIWLF